MRSDAGQTHTNTSVASHKLSKEHLDTINVFKLLFNPYISQFDFENIKHFRIKQNK